MSRNAFGPNLRRRRLQKGITLEQIAKATKVPRDLYAGLESNNFKHWPAGIYARAYVRQYAYAIGVDPDSTVDEFCRWFPQGDRRAERVVREHSEIVGHELTWDDEVPPSAGESDRRMGTASKNAMVAAPRGSQSQRGSILVRLRRALGKA